MAFMLAHPAVMRRLGFRLLEQQDPAKWGDWTHNAYGTPADLPEKERNAEGTIYFDRHYGGLGSDDEMIKKVNELLAKYLETNEAPQPA